MKRFATLILVLCLVLSFTGCVSERTPEYIIDEDWKVSAPEEVGLDAEELSRMTTRIEEQGEIDSVLIVKDGYLVLEEYYNDYDKEIQHEIYSCTKSIMSALIGIALERGEIESIDEKVLDFFPEYEIENLDELKKQITIKDLLTMSSGLEWDESSVPYEDEENDFFQMTRSDDWVKFILDKPVVAKPEEVFNYNSGNSHILSAILQRATGMDTLSYAMKYLFTPLGVSSDDLSWEKDPQGIYFGGAFIRMRPRDMAKFGLLYLNNGRWNGNQIISEKWVKESTLAYIKSDRPCNDYGYQWWIWRCGTKSFRALGYGGQLIIVVKELDMVIVFTAQIPAEQTFNVYNYIIPYIFRAVKK